MFTGTAGGLLDIRRTGEEIGTGSAAAHREEEQSLPTAAELGLSGLAPTRAHRVIYQGNRYERLLDFHRII